VWIGEEEKGRSKEGEECEAMSTEEEESEEEETEEEEEECEEMSEKEDCEAICVPEWQQPITDFFELVPSSGLGAQQQLQGVMASPHLLLACCLRLIPVNSILENPSVPQMGGRGGPCGPGTASAERQLLRQERNLWSSLPSPASAPPSSYSSPPPALGMGPGLILYYLNTDTQ
jgi:hypothetical protein